MPGAGRTGRLSIDTRRILFTTKALRSLGDGMMSIGLAQYAVALGLSGFEAGFVASSALVGTSIMTLLVGQYVERVGRRLVLLGAAVLALATGIAYALTTELAVLVVVAFFGTVNPTSGDVSSFLPVEQAILAQESEPATRVRTFAWYNVIGSLAGAVGALLSGVTGLFALLPGVGTAGSIRMLFAGYSLLGLATFAVTWRLTPSAELAEAHRGGGLGPSRRRVFTLSGLFAADSFSGGLVVQSIVALFLLRKFNLDPAVTGAVFFGTSFFSAVSFLVSARLSMRFGLVNTMVFTHLPANALLVGVAFAPNAGAAIAFLLLRAMLSQMDVPPRQTLVVSVVEPGERAAAAAATGLSRSVASAGAPALGGALLGSGFIGAPFVVCAAGKSAYDLTLFALFRKVRPAGEGGSAERG